MLRSSACSLDSQVRHWARSPHRSVSLMQCITHTHVLVHRGSAQLTHSLCSARSSGSAPASVRAMAEPEQEAQPEAAVTQLDSTQSVDEYGIPRDTPAPVTPPEAFLGGPRFAGRGPTVCWWAPRVVSLCWFPSPVFPPSEQQTCQAKQFREGLSRIHVSLLAQERSRMSMKHSAKRTCATLQWCSLSDRA